MNGRDDDAIIEKVIDQQRLVLHDKWSDQIRDVIKAYIKLKQPAPMDAEQSKALEWLRSKIKLNGTARDGHMMQIIERALMPPDDYT